MSIHTLRQAALRAVDAAMPNFESRLPAGECDEATVLQFLKRRREEIVAAAQGALRDGASVFPAEVVLRLLYGVVSEEELSVVPAE